VDDRLKILVIMGSTREGRFGETVASWFFGLASNRIDLDAELIDLRDFPLRFLAEPKTETDTRVDDTAAQWAAKVGGADGYVIVTPEYNHGYSAVLKNAIDHLYREWNNKPVGFVSYGGGAGGSRAMEQLRTVAIELQMAPIREGLTIAMARTLFDEHGQPADPAMDDRATSMLNQLTWWAQALKAARTATE
jgi:NAD(P)H-dependent FMN reductase